MQGVDLTPLDHLSWDQEHRRWMCRGCNAFSNDSSIWAIKHAYNHYSFEPPHYYTDAPPVLKTYYCSFCEKAGSKGDIMSHCESSHGSSHSQCKICAVPLRLRPNDHPAHAIDCASLWSNRNRPSRHFRKWNYRTLQFDYTNEKAKELLVPQPSPETLAKVEEARKAHIEHLRKLDNERSQLYEHLLQARHSTNPEQIAYWQSAYEKKDEEFKSFCPPDPAQGSSASLAKRLLSSRHYAVYFA